jgi:AcrR family transcriptional regulator
MSQPPDGPGTGPASIPDAGEPAKRRRPGGRSARVVESVLRAVVFELAAGGYSALSIEAVAERAGVSRTTVYRRWPTRAALVRAAFAKLAQARPPPPDTGTLKGDLLELLLRRMGTQSARDLALLRAIMGELANPEVTAIARTISEGHERALLALVERAMARGELPPDTEPRLVFEPIMGTVLMRASLFGAPPTADYVERLVDMVLAGARTGAARRPLTP